MRRDGGADAAPREGRPATAAEDWPRVREILRAALEKDPAQRPAFLDEACGADAALRRSVDALLAAHEEAGDFLEAPSELDRLAASVLGDEGAPALAAGSRVGRYEILELLDAGGMGEVYRARDTGLGRDVAVKVMRPWMTRDTARLRLFEKEARAAGAISDPNILAVFDVGAANGMPYVVSELLEGETLGARLRRSPLTVRESVEYGIQIAQGLCAAHEKGIVHRDLKPENVFLTRQGRLKLLDFGLAKLLHDPREDATPATLSSSSGSGLMGTPGYIAPERLEGQPSDRRVDIFALGAILYRMLARRPAFGSEDTVGELRATLTKEPAPFAPEANVPTRVQRVVWRCLQKRPEHRFQSAHEVRSALQDLAGSPSSARPRWALAAVAALAAVLGATVFFGRGRPEREPSEAPVHRRIRSLAVLPLQNASGDPEQQYFADGMTEALVAEMARTDGLRVLSRDSAAALQDKANRAEIARQLRVDAVVQGSVRRTGPQVRVAVELVRAANDEPVWAGTYDRDVRDVLALHHDVAGAISKEIALVAHPAREHAVHAEARSVEAYEAYLRGRFYWNLRSTEAAPKAIAQFNRALELDPLYAEAYIGLADTYAILGDMDAMPHADAYARAEAAARRALDLDPTRAEGYASLGHLRMHAWRWEEADRLFRRALELDPGYATALQWRSYNLASMGRTSEAVDAIARAQQLDPLSVIINTDMAQILYFARRYDDALAECRQTLQMNPAFAEARRVSFLVLQRVHRDTEALADLETYRGLPDGGPGGSVGYAYAALGRRGEAAAVLRELDTQSRRRFVASYDFAVIHAGLGEADRALAWLDKSLTRHDPETMILPADPRFDSLRGDPRFVALLERMSLPRP
ncbi:MAG TPA: protein kinase [Vicinamibacteria bacterium]